MEERDGLPALGDSARTLGARPHTDIPVSPTGLVRPGQDGMSVSPDDPRNLPRHRLPAHLGGTGKDPLGSIREDRLGDGLAHRPDPRSATHGFIEPATAMLLEDYQRALHATQSFWRRV
jgi:hypothetical protein